MILTDFLPQFYQGRICKYAARIRQLSLITKAFGNHVPECNNSCTRQMALICLCGIASAMTKERVIME
ncbi:hypothetical protein AVEN_107598-1, partial [Araneus ventricosus]